MRLRKGVKLKGEFQSPIRVTTEARGLAALTRRSGYSGESSLSEIEKRAQAEIESIAEGQPHRRAVFDDRGHIVASSDSKRLGTAVGRFCVRHKPRPLAQWLEDAGKEYERIVYEFRKAISAPTVEQSNDGLGAGLLSESAIAELAQMRWNAARDALAAADRQAAVMIEFVCVDDRDPPPEWSPVVLKGLKALADHLKLTPKGFRSESDLWD